MIDLNKLEYKILPGRYNSSISLKEYESAYSLWHSVWSSTFKALEGKDIIFSDNFTRQDEHLALFYGDACVALTSNRYCNALLASTFDDSYFEAWPEYAKQKLKSYGQKLLVGSHITIDPQFRKINIGPAIKYIIMHMIVHRGIETKQDVICGTMRVDKGMDKLFYHFDAIPIARDINYHNVKVDLVAFDVNAVQSPKVHDYYEYALNILFGTAKEQRAA